MTTSNTNPQRPYSRPRPLSAVQTVLWLIAGIAGMFALVSTIFAIKLGLEGNLPFSDAQQPATQAPASAAPTPPVTASSAPAIRSAQAAAPGATFVSGAENILPAEVSHLARNTSALDTPPASNDTPPTPPIPAAPTPVATAPAAPPAPAATAPLAANPTVPAAAPKPATPAAPAGSDTIQTTLQAWASAWSAKNVDAYLSHYASSFKPAGDLDRSAWAEQRRQRIARPGDITVKLDAIDIRVDGDKASARFIQHYRSGNLKLTEPKTIELARSGSAWQIVQERIGH